MDFRALLHPYIPDLSDVQLAQVSTYLDLLLRWNARTNLTAIRDPQQIVTRHFGESFFLATRMLDAPSFPSFGKGGMRNDRSTTEPLGANQLQIVDLGSGAGFPAIPLLIYRPDVTITLVEAHHTKAVFLREVLRALNLKADVKNVRAESLLDSPSFSSFGKGGIRNDLDQHTPSATDQSSDHQVTVTLRAVEKFDSILLTAARLIRTRSHSFLALLISSAQVRRAQELLPDWHFPPEIPIPNSQKRIIQFVEPK